MKDLSRTATRQRWGRGEGSRVVSTNGPVSYEEYLRGAVVERASVDLFLDPERPSWAQFDPVTGYRLADFMARDGVGESFTVATYRPDGARRSLVYGERPHRIATYGNSFTQCHQVSDGETWQEYLAAHLGEPIRNHGVGGFGVCQAYHRLVQEEQSERGVEYVVLYVWGDDHIRSLTRCRHAAIYRLYDTAGTRFQGNFWANIEMNLQTGELELRANLLPTSESLYRMTDPDWMVEALRDDLATRMWAYYHGWVVDLDPIAVRTLADALGVPGRAFADARPEQDAVYELLDRYAFAATEHLLTRAREFTTQHGKQLLVAIFDPFRALTGMVDGKPRYDQQIVDFLREREFRSFDMTAVHAEDFACFAIDFDAYMNRFFVGRVGHYNPTGNHFFAYAIKPTIVDWLDPKPITYKPSDEPWETFADYLRT